VLLVGDSVAFVQQGGCIGFFVEENKVRFAISRDAAKQQHLTISSKLLKLAKVIDH
jgi:hypothetical protein